MGPLFFCDANERIYRIVTVTADFIARTLFISVPALLTLAAERISRQGIHVGQVPRRRVFERRRAPRRFVRFFPFWNGGGALPEAGFKHAGVASLIRVP